LPQLICDCIWGEALAIVTVVAAGLISLQGTLEPCFMMLIIILRRTNSISFCRSNNAPWLISFRP